MFWVLASVPSILPRGRVSQSSAPPYLTYSYDPLLVTKLVRNYRSASSLLSWPSSRFYDGELEARADKEVRRRFQGANYLPNKNRPLVFHGVEGEGQTLVVYSLSLTVPG